MKNQIAVLESVLMVLWIGYLVWQRYGVQFLTWWKARGQKRQRTWTWRPRTPKDCPVCRAEASWPLAAWSRRPRPWSAVKSKRGRPKTVDSEGYACMNPACEYYGETDARRHALRSNGQRRGKTEAIQQWECGACGGTHTARLGTPLYRLKTSSEAVGPVLHGIRLGLSIADASELFGYSEHTVSEWVERGGWHSQRLHKRFFRNLVVQHLQLDELVSRVRQAGRQVLDGTGCDQQSHSGAACGRTNAAGCPPAGA